MAQRRVPTWLGNGDHDSQGFVFYEGDEPVFVFLTVVSCLPEAETGIVVTGDRHTRRRVAKTRSSRRVDGDSSFVCCPSAPAQPSIC